MLRSLMAHPQRVRRWGPSPFWTRTGQLRKKYRLPSLPHKELTGKTPWGKSRRLGFYQGCVPRTVTGSEEGIGNQCGGTRSGLADPSRITLPSHRPSAGTFGVATNLSDELSPAFLSFGNDHRGGLGLSSCVSETGRFLHKTGRNISPAVISNSQIPNAKAAASWVGRHLRRRANHKWNTV